MQFKKETNKMNTTMVVFKDFKIVMTVYNIKTKDRIKKLISLAKRDYGSSIHYHFIENGKIVDEDGKPISDEFV